MTHEVEAVAEDTLVGEMSRALKHSLPLGAPCPNCATALEGPWCHACGQRATKHDRSLRHLLFDALEGLTHADGRLWGTLRRLFLTPGRLTRDYLDGHRAPQIPPFRMFLVVLVAVFFTGTWNSQVNTLQFKLAASKSFAASKGLDARDPAAFKAAAEEVRARTGSDWLATRFEAAFAEPDKLVTAMEHWSHQFAILALPMAALMLSVLFAFKKGVKVFDHLIFSMHSLSFQGLLLSVVFLMGIWLNGGELLLVLSPVHLYRHMRGTYRSSRLGTLVRMFLLFVGSLAGFVVLSLGLVFVGLITLH